MLIAQPTRRLLARWLMHYFTSSCTTWFVPLLQPEIPIQDLHPLLTN